MTEKAQNRAIAYLHGWRDLPEFKGQSPDSLWDDAVIRSCMEGLMINPERKARPCPDFVNSLELMHKTEDLLNPRELWEYYLHLQNAWFSGNIEWKVFRAKPSQRAESILKTLGIWSYD